MATKASQTFDGCCCILYDYIQICFYVDGANSSPERDCCEDFALKGIGIQYHNLGPTNEIAILI